MLIVNMKVILTLHFADLEKKDGDKKTASSLTALMVNVFLSLENRQREKLLHW